MVIQALIGPATKLIGKFIEDKDTKNKLAHDIATMAEKLTEDEIKVSGVPSTYDKQNHIINSSI